MIFYIIIGCVYTAALITYFFVETKPKLFAARVTDKIVMATLYLIVAASAVFTKEIELYKILIFAACCFAWFGDLFLLFKKTFGVGVVFFLLSNITVISAETVILASMQVSGGFIWVTSLVLIAVYGVLVVMQITKFCSFGKYIVPLNIYIFIMTLSGSIGVALAIFGTGVFTALFGIGVTLFMISDYLLGAYLFKFKVKKVLVSNSAFYFTGIFLIALSLLF